MPDGPEQQVQVTSSRLLTPEEEWLIAEIGELSRGSIAALRDALRQITVLSTSVMTIEIATWQFAGIQRLQTGTWNAASAGISLVLLLGAVAMSFGGQLGFLRDVPTLDMLATYRAERAARLRRGVRIYVVATALTFAGLAFFALSIVT